MKSLIGYAGRRKEHNHKQSTNESAAKYWGTLKNTETFQDTDGEWRQRPRKFIRSDGSVSVDKTQGWHSRTVHKETIRNSNRAITKRARQILKRQMYEEMDTGRLRTSSMCCCCNPG